MRRASKVDRNQPEIVAALRKAGASVQPLHAVGQGCPDILCGFRGATYAIEIKDGKLAPSDRKLTPAQKEWHDAWRGQVAVVLSAEDALRVIGVQQDNARQRANAPGMTASKGESGDARR